MIENKVSFQSDKIALAGTLTLPNNVEHPPAVLFIHGSGPLDRNENAKTMALNIFNVLADTLAKNGIASFRYDKRGIGDSKGVYLNTGHFELVEDAGAAFEFIKSQSFAKLGPIYIAGHSEGALIAPQVANLRNDVAGIILLAPIIQELEAVLLQQAKNLKDDIATMPGIGGFLTRIIVSLIGGVKKKQAKAIAKLKNAKTEVVRIDFQKINARWFQEMFSLKPREIMEKIDVQTLIIGGEKDLQCDPADAVEIAKIIGDKAQVHIIDDLNHILRLEPEKARLSNYKKLLKKPLDPIVGQLMLNWIKSRN
ncbi:MAG: lysophospholipase [Devosiaceae bacterium]|nr:lysophospholipase [Devosiaceae bacterium]